MHPSFSLGCAQKEVPSLYAGAGLQPMTSLVDANSHTPSMNTLEINAGSFRCWEAIRGPGGGVYMLPIPPSVHDLQRSRTDEVFDSRRMHHS